MGVDAEVIFEGSDLGVADAVHREQGSLAAGAADEEECRSTRHHAQGVVVR
jgi:hypothetical protein